MTEESIPLNQRFRELLTHIKENSIGRKDLIALAENVFQISNIQAQRLIARNIHMLTKQKLIIASGEKNTRRYLFTPELMTKLQNNFSVKITKKSNVEESLPNELVNEEMKTSAELKLILGEIQAYQDYLIKFPQNNKAIQSLLNTTRDRASDFYGRLSAIKKIIKSTETEDNITC